MPPLRTPGELQTWREQAALNNRSDFPFKGHGTGTEPGPVLARLRPGPAPRIGWTMTGERGRQCC